MSEPDLATLTAQLAETQKKADEALAEAGKLRLTNAELAKRALSEDDAKAYEALKAQAAQAEEDKKKAAGQWDTLKTELTTKHGEELKQRDTTISTLSERFKKTVIEAEFGRATDLFGGATAKTILDVDMAMSVLGTYVQVVDDEKDPRGYRVEVKKANGNPIVGKDGNPLPFTEAIAELISTLPNKDRMLRGSGKTGSGNSGGSDTHQKDLDLDTLTKQAAAGNPDAIKQLKARQAGLSGQVQGSAYGR